MPSIAQRYQRILDKIKQAEIKYDRIPHSVHLIAVSKTKPADKIRAISELGQRSFGENYLQETIEKKDILKDLTLEWHFIGHIQSNKTKDIAEHFDWAHGIDRLKIAKRLSDQRPSNLPPINICIQVNLEGEQTKSGAAPEQVFQLASEIYNLPNIKLRGLMAIPSPNNPFTKQRRLFAELRTLLKQMSTKGINLDVLSMGMTDDMEAAIAEGATHIRIGTALFGARDYS